MEKITKALKVLVSSLEPLSAQQRVLAEVAFALAEKLDSGDGGSMSAALGREIRATLAAMVPAEDESLGRELNAFLQGLTR